MPATHEKLVLFLCTGNYYRSRFAEIVFNSVARTMRLSWRGISRGLALERGVGNVGPISAMTLEGLESRSIRAPEDVSRFPMSATIEDFDAASWIVALEENEHAPLMRERFPQWAERVEYWHVADAPGVLDLVECEVNELAARLIGGGRRRVERVPVARIESPTAPPGNAAAKRRVAKVGRETAGRKGKGVTTIFDLGLDDAALRELAAILKQRCGTGGTVKEGRIEIQGDQRTRIADELERLGYVVKRAGG